MAMPEAPAGFRAQGLQRSGERTVAETRGAQVGQRPAQAVHAGAGELLHLRQQRRHPRRIGRLQPLRGLQLHGQGDQRMAEVIVQVPRQAFALAERGEFDFAIAGQFQRLLGGLQLRESAFPVRRWWQ